MKTYIENAESHPIYVMGRMIPPGEGREVDLPGVAPVDVPQETPQEGMLELQRKPVRDVLAVLSTLSTDQLVQLAQIEGESETPRKTLTTAIEAERLRRSDQALQELQQATEARQAADAARTALQTNTDPDQQAALQAQLDLTLQRLAELGLSEG